MRIVVGADHRGFELKDALAEALREAGHEVTDSGTHGPEPVDYPDIALAVGEAIREGKAERGVLVCGSGVGAAIAACKMRGIRSGICHDTYSAHQGVEHDDMNVLSLGARVVGVDLAREIVMAFVNARFKGEERYIRRLTKVEAMERGDVEAPIAAPSAHGRELTKPTTDG
jgi:ribose 5-phosphate isomerase B